ncbi:MAG TPA: kelch repeat-containing protein [Polyangia bacterium]|nr:kelch repeat-containing protein [Polyangia bacterium]
MCNRSRASRLASCFATLALLAGCSPRSPLAGGLDASVDASGPREAALESDAARARVDELDARFGLAAHQVERFDTDGEWLDPRRAPSELPEIEVRLPQLASSAFRVRDPRSGVAIEVALAGARPAAAEIGRGYALYRGAHPSGADVLQRVTHDGAEDLIAFDAAPASEGVTYQLALGGDAAGLRLVGAVLEIVDAHGAPRLRMQPPWIAGADRRRYAARVSVEGCAFDANPAAPWGRPVTPPGAPSCIVHVDWSGAGVAYPALLDPSWTATGNLITGRAYFPTVLFTAAPLAGKVLVAGGQVYSSSIQFYATPSSELYDPVSGTWAATGSLTQARDHHTATLLRDGRVLIADGAIEINPCYPGCVCGNNGCPLTEMARSEIYNPATGTFTATAVAPAIARYDHTASLLGDGTVLVAGGYNGSSTAQTSAEIFNPTTGLWSAAPSMANAHMQHSATVLQNGKVLIAGGTSYTGGPNTRSAELYDPTSGAWSATGSLNAARNSHSATLLQSGKVLAAGGGQGNFSTPWQSAELYDPSAGTWVSAAGMNAPRVGHGAALLQNGKVIAVSGNTSEIYDPIANNWSYTSGNLIASHAYFGCVAFSNGQVLAAGGAGDTNVAELFALFPNGNTCQRNAECLSGLCANGVCCNSACNDGCDACNVSGSVGTCALLPQGNGGSCGAYVCDGVNPSCPTSCSFDGDCAANDYCSGGVCAPKIAVGGSCGSAGSCQSGFCVSGVCCSTACNGGGCNRCDLTRGTCTIAPSGNSGNPSCAPYACNGIAASCPTTCSSDANCSSGNYCVTNACTPKLANGGACTQARQCSSGFCVDGVCCNSACNGQCQACNLPANSGVCSPVTGAPVAPRGACAGDGSACNGSCDGANVSSCSYPNAATGCRAATCSNGVATAAASCNGSGSCPAPVTTNCGAYVCGATACKTFCLATSDCIAADYCNGTACAPRVPNGSACSRPEQCQSNYCIDGVCCNSACTGQCQACNLTPGTCTTVTGAPVGSRPSCGGTGLCAGRCDGSSATQCTFPGSATNCRSASCAGGTATLAATCDGAGNCPAAQTVACSPYACGATACKSTCSADTDCASGDYCASGACAPKLALGSTCAGANQCVAGNCVDGVCCNSACNGQCQACNLPGAVGTCSFVSGAPVGGRTACTGSGTCGGTCSGASAACVYPSAATSCRAAACAGGVETFAASCDGAGHCPAATTQSCGAYVCGATACRTSCATDGDCIGGDYCASGTCSGKLTLGAACGSGNQCQSGNCVDGVCCNSACNGQCQACNLPAQLGNCSTVSGAPVGARPACVGAGTTCGGACDGINASVCAYPGATSSCRGASCAGGVETFAASCDGAGHCPAAATQSCGPYACGATACKTGCAGDGDCVSGDYCASGACAAKQSNGASCGGANQCASGNCVDGVCCNQACGGQCEACNLAGAIGVCSPVSGAPVGSRPACTGAGTSCGGTCDGVGTATCAYPSAATACRAASCAGGVETAAASCDGAGHCPAPATLACAPYLCGGASCKTTCAADADCIAGGYCSGGACTGKLPLGAACSTGNQCGSSNCVDGVCCDGACNGQCQACNLPASLGTCATVTGAPVGTRAACAGAGTTCGGACDGANPSACRYPSAAQSCRNPTCAGGVATAGASCDGAGHCPAPVTQICAPLVCGTTACLGNCGGDADCVAGDFCNSFGQCAPKQSLGSTCGGASQCASGQCVDGVCCDLACDGQCQACNLPGALGTCSTVTGSPVGTRAACAGSGTACGGACDGANPLACAFPPSSTLCAPASCAGNVAQAAAFCDGAGSCAPGMLSSCGFAGCNGAVCATPPPDGGADAGANGGDGGAHPGDGGSSPLDGGKPIDHGLDGGSGRAPSGGCSSAGRAPGRGGFLLALGLLALLFTRRKLT